MFASENFVMYFKGIFKVKSILCWSFIQSLSLSWGGSGRYPILSVLIIFIMCVTVNQTDWNKYHWKSLYFQYTAMKTAHASERHVIINGNPKLAHIDYSYFLLFVAIVYINGVVWMLAPFLILGFIFCTMHSVSWNILLNNVSK